jgi:hypothetical protein
MRQLREEFGWNATEKRGVFKEAVGERVEKEFEAKVVERRQGQNT